jgi:5-methylthioribose kinase
MKKYIKLIYLTFIQCTCKLERHKQSFLSENYEQTINKLWTNYKQTINKLWRNYEQTMNYKKYELTMNEYEKTMKNYKHTMNKL